MRALYGKGMTHKYTQASVPPAATTPEAAVLLNTEDSVALEVLRSGGGWSNRKRDTKTHSCSCAIRVSSVLFGILGSAPHESTKQSSQKKEKPAERV
jgi:hypothetical protein